MANASEPIKSAIVGFTFMGTTTVLGHPLDTIKVRVQSGCRQHLFRNLWRGLAFPLLSSTPNWTLAFLVYGSTLEYLERSAGQPSKLITSHALAGAFAGALWGCLINPWELLKCYSQTNRVSAAIAFRTLWGKGPRTFTRGLSFALARDVIGVTTYFTTYEYFKNKQGMTTAQSGALSGMAVWCGIFGFDTLKTRYQTKLTLHGWKQTLRDCRTTSRVELACTFGLLVARAGVLSGIGWWAAETAADKFDEMNK